MSRLCVHGPLGDLTLEGDGDAVTALHWGRAGADDPDRLLDRAARELAAYFADPRRPFTVPLAPGGTRFQNRVWAAMRAIPPGHTQSYGDVAAKLRTAARAVGQACGANPIPILIPCHRITGAAGMGGYGGAKGPLEIKRWLLRHEGAQLPFPGLPVSGKVCK